MRLSLVVGSIALVAGATSAIADQRVGRWCDQWIPNDPSTKSVVEIFKENSGSHYLTLSFGDGSSGRFDLSKKNAREYMVVGSNTGDGYRVKGGTLTIFDNFGDIRTARRDNGSGPRCAG